MPEISARVTPAVPLPQGRGGIVTPFQFVFTGEDRLRMTCFCAVPGASIKTTWRFLSTDSNVSVANSDVYAVIGFGTEESKEMEVGIGAISNLVVRALDQRVHAGELWVRIDVIRGRGAAATVLGTLLAGNVQSAVGRAWPGSPLEGPAEGPGRIKLLQGGTVAPGVAPRIDMPDYCRWRVISLFAALTASGAGLARQVFCQVLQSGTVISSTESSLVHPPGSIAGHTFLAGGGQQRNTGANAGEGALPNDLYLTTSGAPDATVLIAVINNDAADQWTQIRALIEEWRNPIISAVS